MLNLPPTSIHNQPYKIPGANRPGAKRPRGIRPDLLPPDLLPPGLLSPRSFVPQVFCSPDLLPTGFVTPIQINPNVFITRNKSSAVTVLQMINMFSESYQRSFTHKPFFATNSNYIYLWYVLIYLFSHEFNNCSDSILTLMLIVTGDGDHNYDTIRLSSVEPSITASSVRRLWRDQCVFQSAEQTFMQSDNKTT